MARTRKTAPRTPGTFVAYYRVSDEKQGISRLGLESQQESVRRYLAHVKGTLVAEFTEVESGKDHRNRPQLNAALAACRKGGGATLIIAKLDRLARNVHFISGLMEAAADFVAVDMPAANKLTLHIMAAMAEHEREMISARTKDGLAQIQRHIAETGSHTVRRDGKEWTITKLGNPRWDESIARARAARNTPKQQEQVRQMIRDRHRAGDTLRQIADKLNNLGIKTPTNATWYASSVRAALLSASRPAQLPEQQQPPAAA